MYSVVVAVIIAECVTVAYRVVRMMPVPAAVSVVAVLVVAQKDGVAGPDGNQA